MDSLFPGHPAGAQRYKDNALEGLAIWAELTDLAIVTTHPETLDGFYEYLMARKPANLSLIGGVSTYSLPGCTDKTHKQPYDFADAAEWQRIVERCRRISKATGIDIVLLENEYALHRFHEGENVDLARLRKALAPLRETGLSVLWYLPTIQAPSREIPNQTERTAALLRAIHEAVPKARFVCGHIGYPGWDKSPEMQWRRQVMLGSYDCIDYLFASPDGVYAGIKERVWMPRAALDEIKRLGLPGVIVYPGAGAWCETAKAFVAEVQAERTAKKP